jgi:hypothetical protein
MTMGIMSIYICAAISYNLGKHYEKSISSIPLCAPCCRSWPFADCGAENEWHAAGG